jgi:hypothetical protein
MRAKFWGEAVLMMVYILNRSPTKGHDEMTPYEAWHGRKPAVGHLRVFGSLVYVKELNHIGKLDDRSTTRVFIGYDGVKGYYVLDPVTHHVRMACDVVFDEGRGWTWAKMVDDGTTPTYEDFIVDYVHYEGTGGVCNSTSLSVPHSVPRTATSSSSTLTAARTSTAVGTRDEARTPAERVPLHQL